MNARSLDSALYNKCRVCNKCRGVAKYLNVSIQFIVNYVAQPCILIA